MIRRSDLKPTFLLDKESDDHLDKLMMVQHFVVDWMIPYFKRREEKRKLKMTKTSF